MNNFRTFMTELPLVAILRGLRTETAVDVATVLIDAGFRTLEVPLNSPTPFDTIGLLADRFGDRAMIGAGTVMTPDQVAQIAERRGQLVVTPHFDPIVVTAAKRLDLICAPGVATPSEAFAALAAGADALKLFPAEALPPAVVKAWRAVLPPKVSLIPVGGIQPETMGPYFAAGANGFGLGSALFKPDMTLDDIAVRARAFVDAYAATQGET